MVLYKQGYYTQKRHGGSINNMYRTVQKKPGCKSEQWLNMQVIKQQFSSLPLSCSAVLLLLGGASASPSESARLKSAGCCGIAGPLVCIPPPSAQLWGSFLLWLKQGGIFRIAIVESLGR